MIKVNAMGDACPIPVIKTKKAIAELPEGGIVEVLVDNEIAVQNLTKMAKQKSYGCQSQKLEENKYQVNITVSADAAAVPNSAQETAPEEEVCYPDSRKKKKVVVIRSSKMGEGSDELGKILMKGFLYALTELDELPSTILFYNGGAYVSCEGSDSIEDLRSLEAQGVEILTCGTCLNHYGLTEKLAVGGVTNMYVIAETMSGADLIICP